MIAAYWTTPKRHTQSTNPIDYEYRVRNADGDYRCWLDKAVPVLDGDGRPLKRVGVCTDITERHQAEERQRLAETVFNHALEGILVTDADARIIDVNQAFSTITGYSRDEVLGKNPQILSSGRQDGAFYDALWQTLRDKGFGPARSGTGARTVGDAEMLSINAIRDDDGQVQRYVGLFSDITTQKEQQQQLERIAYHDALTDLPNRMMLGDRLGQAMRHADRHGSMLAVVYLDLDGFKDINDAYGHDVGDQVLVEVARRMQGRLREDDTLARLGGDEFVAILANLNEPADCAALLPRLLDAVARPLAINNRRLNVSASLGVALYLQAGPLDADQPLRQGDQAMYQAKLAGKNRYHFFDTEHDLNVRRQVELVAELRGALARREFVLYYQPKVNMRTACWSAPRHWSAGRRPTAACAVRPISCR